MADKLPAFIQTEIEQAIKAATAEDASFGTGTVMYGGKEYDLDAFIKERIQLHHQTWIVMRLKRVLQWSAGRYKGGF